MSNYPNALDDDTTLPRIDDNISSLGGDAINALRSAMFAVEATLGINPQGSASSLAAFLSVSFAPNGTILPSSLAGIGLVYLPITDIEISPTAAIQESKIALHYSTTSLYNLFLQLNNAIEILNGFLSLTGIKVEPHIAGTAYNHELSAILVDSSLPMLKTLPGSLPSPGTSIQNRNTTDADTLVQDISNDLITHEKADGTPNILPASGGTVPPIGFAHNSTGLYVDPSEFSTIPKTIDTVQEFANYVDQSSLLLLGSRIQTLYANGIPITSRSSSMINDGYGAPLVPPTPVIAYLLGVPPGPTSSSPVDNINDGDDIILFQPSAAQLTNSVFDAQFAQVQPGDIITINYDNNTGLSYQFVIDSIKSQISGNNRTYAVRINGKNLFSADGYGLARIDQSLFQREKYGVLATAGAPNQFSALESLIIANPRSAVALGNGYDATGFDSLHYNLYLILYPYGNPTDGYMLQLPAIDMTGNKGVSPGEYSIDSIINTTNTAFRAAGYNYRFIAFQYQGNIGIMLADPYNNASFSIIGGSGVDSMGTYNYGSGTSNANATTCPNNVVDNPSDIDPCGFGITGANVATPPPYPIFTYINPISASLAPTILFYPLARNYYYVNGAERDRLNSDPLIINQIVDQYGDGYWPGNIYAMQSFASPGHVQVSYIINLGLDTSGLKIGKTLVVQPNLLLNADGYSYNARDYGRFLISNVQFYNCNTANAYTVITVYDAVHGVGSSPASTSAVGTPVNIYFDDDSVAFDNENVYDSNSAGYPYRRYFEVFIDQNGHSFSHERGRFSTTGLNSIGQIEYVSISPKLRGYPGSNGISIRLQINGFDASAISTYDSVNGFDATTGIFTGQLGRWDNSFSAFTNWGPFTFGKKGETVRFYDETNIDYIDFKFDLNASMSTFGTGTIDIQLFPSLQEDEELMCVSSCQVDDNSKQVSVIEDLRQFGNISEEQLSTSALDYIAAPDKFLRENGIIQGFDTTSYAINGSFATIAIPGGGANPILGNLANINEYDVGKSVTISGAHTSTNNGTFVIASVISSTSLSYINASATADINSGSLTWSVNQPQNSINITGGVALINGKIVNINNQIIDLPILLEALSPSFATTENIGWYICANQDGEIELIGSTTLYASSSAAYSAANLDQNRLMYVVNPNTSNAAYVVRATYLENLFLNFKDVVPLYYVQTVVGLTGGTATPYIMTLSEISDIRRYVSNGINGLNTFVLAPDGNFRSFGALNQWLSELTNSNGALSYESEIATTAHLGYNVLVKGDWVVDGNTGLGGYDKIITYTGDGATFIINSVNPIIIGSNIICRNIQFDNQYDPQNSSDPNWISANPGYLSNYANGCLYVSGNGGVIDLQNITIDNCLFTCSNTVSRYPFITINLTTTTSTIENLNITNNQFFTTLTNDQLSVISIVDTASTSAASTEVGTRIINCNIDNNICNQNQLIVFSSIITSISGGIVINDAIIPINCSISNNICGAICFAIGEDVPNYPGNNYPHIAGLNSAFYNYAILDKENLLTISNNNCKFIYLGSADGSIGRLIFEIGFWFVIDGFTNIMPGSVSIYDNICSWIHIGSSYYANSISYIRNNKLVAFDPNFLNNYYINGTNVSTLSMIDLAETAVVSMNTAIFVKNDHSAVSGLNQYISTPGPNLGSNVLISQNITLQGEALTTSSGVKNYLYNSSIIIVASAAIMQDNILSGVGIASQTTAGSGTTNIINIFGAICRMTNNTFIRDTLALASYINSSASDANAPQDLYIVGNTFDNYTVDGTNIYPIYPTTSQNALIGGALTPTSTYIQNINQTNTLTIALTDYINYFNWQDATGVGLSNTGPALAEVFENTIAPGNSTVIGSNIFPGQVQILRATNNNTVGSAFLYIVFAAGSNFVQRNISMTLPIDTSLPPAVKIVSAQMGVWLQESTPSLDTSVPTHNQITLALAEYQNSVSNAFNTTQGILDVKNCTSTPSVGFLTDNAVALSNTYTIIISQQTPNSSSTYSRLTEATIAGATQYCNVVPAYGAYVTGSNNRISIEVNINLHSNNGLGPAFAFAFSPIVITYRW